MTIRGMDDKTREAYARVREYYAEVECVKTFLLWAEGEDGRREKLEKTARALADQAVEEKDRADYAVDRVAKLEKYIVSICQEKALHGSAPSMIAEAIRLGIPTLDAMLFEHMEGEVTPLQKKTQELEKLKAEYEVLRVSAENWLRQRDLVIDREEALRTRIVELEADVACKHVTLDEVPGGILLCGHLDDSPLRPFMTAIVEERDALQAFKDFVHARLDKAGVPVDPPGEHRDAGCRIGQRLDLVLGKEKKDVEKTT